MKLKHLILPATIIIVATVGAGCKNKPSTEDGIKGVSLSPKNFQSSDFTNFFSEAKQTGDVVSWAGDWNELTNAQNGGPTVLATLASQYGYTPVIEAQFFKQSNGKLLRPLDSVIKKTYKEAAVTLAEKYKLKYLALGIEVNILYEKSPADFDNFVKFYGEVYDAVKEKSPNTKVFTIFQLEKMKGLNGGLFGGVNNAAKSQWTLLDKFPKSDIVAFTTYPGLIFKNPLKIPKDYYSEIKSHTAKPIAFTEIGWQSDTLSAEWKNSETKQAEFIKTFFDLTKDLNKEMSVWSFMYDPETFEPFRSMGLRRRSDGTAKPAWNEWIKAK